MTSLPPPAPHGPQARFVDVDVVGSTAALHTNLPLKLTAALRTGRFVPGTAWRCLRYFCSHSYEGLGGAPRAPEWGVLLTTPQCTDASCTKTGLGARDIALRPSRPAQGPLKVVPFSCGCVPPASTWTSGSDLPHCRTVGSAVSPRRRTALQTRPRCIGRGAPVGQRTQVHMPRIALQTHAHAHITAATPGAGHAGCGCKENTVRYRQRPDLSVHRGKESVGARLV